MIHIHDIFVCKPGNASKLAKLCKEAMTADKHVRHIMTDMTGQFNRVIIVSEYENLTDYEKSWEEMMNPTPEMKEAMKKMEGYQDMYLTGGREIYKVW
ncbi:MAG: hypothetical protein UY99_C0004G0017 [Parcubacteria group bacterium GW2011_GWA1_59_11]|nr:MAG: hypothetical protein UY99_C0004G0017 [Parcubacteria group bacterium GW2011_GWA1_59_11]